MLTDNWLKHIFQVNCIPYKDSGREKQRLAKLKLASKTEKPVFKNRKVDDSWSHQKEVKEKRADRKEKRERRRIAIAKNRSEDSKG